MSACTMALMGLLFLSLVVQNGQASVIVGCPTFRYMLNGTCVPCPDNCRKCVSNTKCELSTMGFFGPICENRCEVKCTGTCHKSFGHCTEGCPDGEYPSQYDHCIRCPPHCSLCTSQSKCIMCDVGYYGEICQNRCPDICTTCNKTAGQCLQCKDSYFKLNGQCRRCPYGCELCVTAKNCSHCKDGYFPSHGLCKRCLYGCRMCITAEKCHSCEDGFQGPVHDLCIYKCPIDGVTTYKVQYKDGRCGLWQDRATNICHLQSESHSCTSSGTCLQDIVCPVSVRCVDETFIQAACATAMQYECKHKCEQLLSSYGCEANCTIEARDNGKNSVLCMTDIGSIDANIFQNTTEAYCNQQQVTPTNSTSWPTDRIVLLVCVIICVITILTLIALMYRWTCRRGLTKQNESKEEENSMLMELTRPHNRTNVHILSATRPDDEQTTEPMSNMSMDESFESSRQKSRSQSFSSTVC